MGGERYLLNLPLSDGKRIVVFQATQKRKEDVEKKLETEFGIQNSGFGLAISNLSWR